MRVADLLSREPFGAILELTLSSYWSTLYGSQVDVSWKGQSSGRQEWRGNSFLNFFCTRDVDRTCFENIIREFSHTSAWWRRGVQAAYVGAAITPPFREWMAQVHFCVSRDIPGANQQLLIGGRNRLRIIRPNICESVVIAKSGFSRLGFEREVAARGSYAKAVAPKFLGMRANGLAFAEEYYVGSPANRLPPQLAVQARADACSRLIEVVHRPSLRAVELAEYIQGLALKVQSFANVAGERAYELAAFASRLCGSAPIGLALTHGDFQDANILVTQHDLRIIDWETAYERSQLYDIATLSTSIRLAADGFDTWRRKVSQWVEQPNQVPALLIPMEGCDTLLGHAAVWWMEEAIFRLEEARAGFYSETGTSDRAVATGLARALKYLETVSR